MKRYLSLLRNAYRIPAITTVAIGTLIALGVVLFLGLMFSYGFVGVLLSLLINGLGTAPLCAILYKNMFTNGELKAWLYPDEYDSRRYEDRR